jgi:hypothetical protein
MEVISSNDGILCNFEVLETLNIRKKQRTNAPNPIFNDRDTIEFQTRKYIDKYLGVKRTQADCQLFITTLKKSGLLLTEAEYVGLLNFLPTSVVEIHLVRLLYFSLLYPYSHLYIFLLACLDRRRVCRKIIGR